MTSQKDLLASVPTHLLIGVLDRPAEYLTDLGLTADAIRRSGAGRVITKEDEAALKGIGVDIDAIAEGVRQ